MTLLTRTTSTLREAPARDRFTLFVVVVLLMAFKSNDALILPQFWAEDGTVFFTDQFGNAWPQLFTPYAGYLLAIPRLVAWFASCFSVERIPLVYNVTAILLSSAAIAFTCRRMRFYLPPLVVALSLLAVPTNGEIFGTLTNVQWFLQLYMAVCCLTPATPSQPRMNPWARGVGIFLVALTGPFSVLLLCVLAGLMATSLLARRTRIDPFNGALSAFFENRDWHAVGATTLGGLIQAAVIYKNPTQDLSQHSPFWVLETTFTDLLPPHIFGGEFLTATSWLMIYALIAVSILTAKRVDGHARLTILAFAAYGAIECFAPMLRMTDPDALNPLSGDRYFYLAKVVWWWAVWICLSCGPARSQANATVIVCALISLFALTNLDHLRRAPFKDFDWHNHSAQLHEAGTHVIPINPYDWKITIAVEAESAEAEVDR
jgi:hypothetical protein